MKTLSSINEQLKVKVRQLEDRITTLISQNSLLSLKSSDEKKKFQHKIEELVHSKEGLEITLLRKDYDINSLVSRIVSWTLMLMFMF